MLRGVERFKPNHPRILATSLIPTGLAAPAVVGTRLRFGRRHHGSKYRGFAAFVTPCARIGEIAAAIVGKVWLLDLCTRHAGLIWFVHRRKKLFGFGYRAPKSPEVIILDQGPNGLGNDRYPAYSLVALGFVAGLQRPGRDRFVIHGSVQSALAIDGCGQRESL